MSLPARKLAPVDDLLAIPEEGRFHEIIDGELVRKAMPSQKHGGAQASLTSLVFRPYNRRPGGRWPGGWWIATGVESAFDPHQIYRPDVAGWRRERTAEGYLTVLTAARGERVRVEPFDADAIEWPVGVLFGDDPDDEA